MTRQLVTQSYRFNPVGDDLFSHWTPEEPSPRQWEYNYNENLSNHDNALILADKIVKKLNDSYSILNIDPSPNAVPIWGENVFGAEVFYQNQLGTMRISARIRI